jgi:hypothetical protein
MLLDFAADKVIQKYQGATCEQLRRKNEPPLEREVGRRVPAQRFAARVAFIDKIAAPF